MSERPILFRGQMVRGIQSNAKKQTRRICSPAPLPDARFAGGHYFPGRQKGAADISVEAPYVGLACPHGNVGDRLWVRETFFAWGRWESRYSAERGCEQWHFVDMTIQCGKDYGYLAAGRQPEPMGGKRHHGGGVPRWWTRPAIFMPRAASRITLEISKVRVERLQQISEADAAAEGGQEVQRGAWSHEGLDLSAGACRLGASAVESFRMLWQSINGEASWDENPWVWAIDFQRVDATGQRLQWDRQARVSLAS